MDKSIFDVSNFKAHHEEQVHHRSQKDIFFIWMLIVFICVIAAHLVLNLGGSPTGFVTASESPVDNTILFLGAIFVVVITILITGLIYTGVTEKDY